MMLREVLSKKHDVYPVEPSNHDNTDVYDVAVCVGPVSSCPKAERKVLLTFGCTSSHPDLGWDVVGVTSLKAKRLAEERFGTEAMLAYPAISGLHIARAHIVEPFENPTLIHASEFGLTGSGNILMMGVWGDKEPEELLDIDGQPAHVENGGLFNLFEFNSRIIAGGIGYYPDWMEDGYDTMVRRHLSLGGRVVCPLDEEVLGGLAEHCFDSVDAAQSATLCGAVRATGNSEKYAFELEEMITP
jgi:hypothetical protein